MKASNELRVMARKISHQKVAVSWSKGHFEAVAGIIKDMEHKETKKIAAIKFAKLFLTENKNFRTKQFITVCGIPNPVKVVEEIEQGSTE